MSLSNTLIQFIRNCNLNPLWLKLLDVLIAESAERRDEYADIAGGILAGSKPANEAMSVSFIGKHYAGRAYARSGRIPRSG